jgi:hypothetical protein
LEAVVGALVGLNVITGFEGRKGPGGGIGKAGEKRVSATPKDANGKKTTRAVEFPEGFLAKLVETVETLCIGTEAGSIKAEGGDLVTIGCSVPRRDIAKAMGLPGSDTEVLISNALNSGNLPGFASKRGVGGGICRLAQGQTPAPVQAEAEVVEPAQEPAVEAAPEPEAPVEAPEEISEEALQAAASESPEEEHIEEAAPESAEQPVAAKPKRNRKGKKAA